MCADIHVHTRSVIAGTVAAPSPESSSKKAFFGRLTEHVHTIDDMDNFSPIFGVREHPEEEVVEVVGQALLELDTADYAHSDKLANIPSSMLAAESFAEKFCTNYAGGKTGLNKDRVAAITMREYLVFTHFLDLFLLGTFLHHFLFIHRRE